MDNTYITVKALVDFSNAFTSFDIHLAVLKSINIPSDAIEWFDSYLSGHEQCVRSDNNPSTYCSFITSVPRGGVLSPPLFSYL